MKSSQYLNEHINLRTLDHETNGEKYNKRSVW